MGAAACIGTPKHAAAPWVIEEKPATVVALAIAHRAAMGPLGDQLCRFERK
jgi:hypothetical protein